MKIVVLGATGMAGAAIVTGASRRGHRVVAASRHPRPEADPRVTPAKLDLLRPCPVIEQTLLGADGVVLAVRMEPGQEADLAPLTTQLLHQTKVTGARTLVVGGAGPLRSPYDHEMLVADDPRFVPPQWRDLAKASVHQLAACTAHQNQNWIYVSPSAVFEPGAGTGLYQRGEDTLLLNPDGTSRVHPPEVALAVLDELEDPSDDHRFTVIEGYAGAS